MFGPFNTIWVTTFHVNFFMLGFRFLKRSYIHLRSSDAAFRSCLLPADILGDQLLVINRQLLSLARLRGRHSHVCAGV